MTTDALEHGEWRTIDGIQRWTPTAASLTRTLAGLRFVDLIACPTCRARIAQSCKTKAGNPREPHVTRLVPRRCPCGARLAARKTYCEDCRRKARKATYKRRERRQATATRRAA